MMVSIIRLIVSDPVIMNHHLERAKVDSTIKHRFSASFMSDSKWVKLLKALTEIGDSVRSCKVKLIWDDSLRDLRIDSNLSYKFDFYAHSMEAMISGYPTGFYDYKELEWIEFSHQEQDIEKIGSCIKSIGQFELEKTADGLRLYAYK